MDSLIKLIDSLAWPITVLILVSLFRSELKKIFTRLSSLKYKDFEASFEKELQEAESSAGALLLPTPKDTGTPPPEPEIKDTGRLSRIAEVSPRAAIMEAWIEVERAIVDIAKNLNLPFPERRPTFKLMNLLVEKEIINKDIVSIYNKLRRLRNEAVHAPDFALDSGEAERFLELAKGLVAYLLYVTKQM